MIVTKRLSRWLAPSLFLLLALACTTQQAAAPFQPPEPTTVPDIAATVTARDRALPQGGTPPTAVPPEVSQAAGDFAIAYDSLSRDWDQLHRDLDAWRLRFTSCHESSVPVALIGFSGDFKAVSQAARDLSRHPTVRATSDQLITAAQTEESALRRLRDSWQMGQSGPSPELIPQQEPGASFSGGNVAPGPAPGPEAGQEPALGGGRQTGYEDVALARYESLNLRKLVADQLSDLERRTSVDSQNEVKAFLAAFDVLSDQWDQFHEEYDSFRVDQTSLTFEETLGRLNLLVDQHRQLVLEHRDLPVTAAAQPVSDILADAVQTEDSVLRRLRNSFQDHQNGAKAGAYFSPKTPTVRPRLSKLRLRMGWSWRTERMAGKWYKKFRLHHLDLQPTSHRRVRWASGLVNLVPSTGLRTKWPGPPRADARPGWSLTGPWGRHPRRTEPS